MSSVSVNNSPSAVADVEPRNASGKQSIPAKAPSALQRPVWIDLDNSPHVPFFRPIIKELEARGCPVLVTARDCFQVCGLAEQLQVECKPIGRHYGKHRAMKLLGVGVRTLQLMPSVFRTKPILAVAHGSRSQLVAATMMGVPTLQIVDYEFAKIWAGVRPTWVLTPDMIPDRAISLEPGRVLKYPGIKEDVYVPSFVPQDGIRAQLGVSEQEILVTIRPPASEAHYHSPDSDKLFEATINHLSNMPNVRMVVLPRTPKQGQEIYAAWPALAASRKLWIPEGVVDGLNLIWHSDLVISGGGTMNREAAALGVPVYSIFRGTIGSVDKYLAAQGRMVLLESPADLPTKLHVVGRNRSGNKNTASQITLNSVTQQIVRLAELGTKKQTA